MALRFVYTRETHPGENITPHQSWEEKQERAKRFRDDEHLLWTVWVDDLDGPVHQALGGGPNMAVIIHRDGRLVYRSEWTDVEDLQAMMAHLRRWDEWDTQRIRNRPNRVESLRAWVEDEDTHEVRERTYDRAGKRAREDFERKKGQSPT